MESALIQQLENIAYLNKEEEQLVTGWFKEERIRKGTYFLKEGKICRRIGFVGEGVLRYSINDKGEDKTYAFASENQFVSNYESFIPSVPSKISIQALEDCTMYIISYDQLQEMYQKINAGERMGRKIIELVFIQTLKDLRSFYTDSPEKRYQNFIHSHRELQQRVPQYYIASYVGVKPQSLSRIRARMLHKG